ncbi:DUF1835 domain-containing protein [Oceanobacillus sp. CAU 1775]
MNHIIFGAAAAGSLKHALRKKDHQVIEFPIDFSVGPIANIHEEIGVNQYFSWLKSSFLVGREMLDNNRTIYLNSLQQLLKLEDGEQVTIWTSENAAEQIGLRISCYLLKDKNIELSFVNTFHAMTDYTKHMEVKVDIRHTGECSTEQLLQFYEHSNLPILEKKRIEYEQEGEMLLNTSSIVRTWRNEEIVHEEETRDDSFILESVKKLHHARGNQEFINATRVIGEVIGNSELPISDSWIEYRIRALIHSKKLAFEGDHQSMRRYKIKLF